MSSTQRVLCCVSVVATWCSRTRRDAPLESAQPSSSTVKLPQQASTSLTSMVTRSPHAAPSSPSLIAVSAAQTSILPQSKREVPLVNFCKKESWLKLLFEFAGKTGFLDLSLVRPGFVLEIRRSLIREGLRFDAETVQVRRLEGLDNHSRAAAITMYGRSRAKGDAESALVLIRLSRDQCDSVRASVVRAMVSVVEKGDRVAIACLVKFLIKDTAQIVREAALLNLPHLGTKDNSEAVVKLLASLANPDTRSRLTALQELGEVAMAGDPIALEALILCADDKVAKIRATAIRSMGLTAERIDGKTASQIVNAFGDKDELVRLAAVQAIKPFSFGNIAAVIGLRQRVEDASDSVRASAIATLVQAVSPGDEETINCITLRLRDMAEKASIRECALRGLAALARAGDGGVLSLLTNCLDDSSELLRRAALELLVQLPETGISCDIEKILILLNDPDGKVQVAAIAALVTFSEKGSSRTIANLATCLTKRNEDVCIASAQALTRVAEPGDRHAIRHLLDAICGQQRYQGATCAAVMALAELVPRGHADAVVIDTLCGFLCEPKTVADVRLASLKALAAVVESGSQQVIDSIEAQRKDKSGKVRHAADQALANLERVKAAFRFWLV